MEIIRPVRPRARHPNLRGVKWRPHAAELRACQSPEVPTLAFCRPPQRRARTVQGVLGVSSSRVRQLAGLTGRARTAYATQLAGTDQLLRSGGHESGAASDRASSAPLLSGQPDPGGDRRAFSTSRSRSFGCSRRRGAAAWSRFVWSPPRPATSTSSANSRHTSIFGRSASRPAVDACRDPRRGRCRGSELGSRRTQARRHDGPVLRAEYWRARRGHAHAEPARREARRDAGRRRPSVGAPRVRY